MKYRLFGRDALTDHEWNKITQWGVAKRQFNEFGQPLMERVRIKKKVMKKKKNNITGDF